MESFITKGKSPGSLDEDKFHLNKYVEIVRKRKIWAILIFCLIFFPVAIVTSLKSFSPVYETMTTIWINSPGDAPAFFNDSAIQNEGLIQILRSRTFAEKVVLQLGLPVRLSTREPSLFEKVKAKITQESPDDSLNFNRDFLFDNIVTNENITQPGDYELYITAESYYLYKIEEDKEDTLMVSGPTERLFLEGLAREGFHLWLNDECRDHVPFRMSFMVKGFRQAVEDLMANTTVKLDESGNFLRLLITDGDPHLATRIANTLSRMFVDYNLSTKKEQLRTTLRILEDQLDVASGVLAESEKAIKEYKEKTGIVSLATEVKERIDRLAEAETSQKMMIEERVKLNDYLKRIKNGSGTEEDIEGAYLELVSFPWMIHSPAIGILRDELVELRGTRNSLALKVTENHPDFQEVEAQIEQVHKGIHEAANSLSKRLEEEISFQNGIISGLRSELNDLPSEELTLARLTRESKVNENIYTQVITKYKEAQIAEAAEIGDIHILDPAIVPTESINDNNRTKIASIGFLLGLLLGVFGALTIEYLDTTVKSEEDVKSNLNITILGISPLIEFDEKYEHLDYKKAKEVDSILVTHDYSPTPIGEAYRALRTNLMFSRRTGHNQTMVVTSPSPGDGKSFTVSNLAITMAQQGARVLLVDADLRRGVLHNTFACQKSPGLTEILTGRSHLMEALNETHVPNLFLVSCGNLIPNPSELLGSSRMMDFFHEVRERFDVIFFDTPPIATVTDATVLGSQVDGVAVVLRAGKTDFREAQRSMELLDNVSANIIGVILNGIKVETSRYKYSYYHY